MGSTASFTFRGLGTAALLSSTLALSGPAVAGDVGVSIEVSQPGVYGRIDIGRFPQPKVIVAQPVVIKPVPQRVAEPVHLWVPPGHRKNWGKHCGRYNACGVPVYFVDDAWYEQNVNKGGKKHGHPGKGHEKGQGKGQDKH